MFLGSYAYLGLSNPLETVLQAVAALVAVAQLDPCFFTENSEAAFKGKDTKLYPDCAKGGGGGFRYPTVLERYKVRRQAEDRYIEDHLL